MPTITFRPTSVYAPGPNFWPLTRKLTSQLFDLATDPGEWHNLSGRPALAALEEELRNRILSQFDPEQLAAAGAESVQRRLVIKEALARNGIHWDYFPYFDASQQYVR